MIELIYGSNLSWIYLSLIAIFTFVSILFIIVTGYIAYVRHRYSHLPGPPCTSFFLGNVPEINESRKRGEFLSVLFLAWAEKYGSCFRVHILHKCLVHVSEPQILKELLTKSKYIKSPSIYKKLFNLCGIRFVGNGLLSETDHSRWHARRSVINPAFHKKYLRKFMSNFNEVGDKLVDTLRKHSDTDEYFSMHDYMCRITLDAISEVGFGFKMNAIESGENEFITSILQVLQGLSKKMKIPLLEYWPSEREFKKKVADAIRFLRYDFGRRMLKERREGKNDQTESDEGDILTYIMKTKEQIAGLDDEDLLDDLMTLFIAGQETTSNVLSFFFLEAGKRPDIITRLVDEVDSVVGSRSDIEYEDLAKLEYLGQVIKETLRLYPPASGTTRYVAEDLVIDGVKIPGNTTIFCSFFITHRLARHYPDPEEFKPERFAKNADRPLFTYMPFSLGHRSCIGQQFATIEAKTLLCKFFQNFTFSLDPDQSMEIQETATLRPKGGSIVKIYSRI